MRWGGLWLCLMAVPVLAQDTGTAFSTPGYNQCLDEGSALARRRRINFIGAGVACVDNAVSSRTDCTVTGGGAGGAPTTASYVVMGLDATLTAERVLTGGAGTTVTDGGAEGNATVATASQESSFLADGGTTNLTCGGGTAGKMQVMDAGALQWCDGSGQRRSEAAIFNAVDYGAVCDGVTNDTAAAQAAIDAARTSGGVVHFPCGICVVTGLTLDTAQGMTIEGCGPRYAYGVAGEAHGTLLEWQGLSTGSALLFRDVRNTTVRDIGVHSSLSFPMHSAIRMENGAGTTVVPTHNTVENVWIDGNSSGGLTYGIAMMLGAGGDANNDFTRVLNAAITNYTTAAFFVDSASSQSVGHSLEHIACTGNGFGDSCVKLDQGQMYMRGGGGGGHDVADIVLTNPNRVVSVVGADFESSTRFLTRAGGVWAVSLMYNRWAGNAIHADGKSITHEGSGPLVLIGNALCESATGDGLCKIDFTSTNAAIRATIVGNDMGCVGYATLPLLFTASTLSRDILYRGNVFKSADATCGVASLIPTWGVGDTTPAVHYASSFVTANIAPTTITQFDGGFPGHEFSVACGDTNTTFQHGANIQLAQGANFTCVTGIDLAFRHDGTQWREVGRMDDVPEAGDFGALALTGDVASTGLATTVQPNAVALATDTTGNYIASLTNGTGLTGFPAAGENATGTPAWDYTATLAGNPTLAAGQCVASTTGFLCEGATADLIETLLTLADPTATDKTITLPNASGTVAVSVTAPVTLSALGDIGVTNGDLTTSGALSFSTTRQVLGGATALSLATSPGGAATVVGTGRTLTGGAGIAALGDLSADRTVATASGETDFLASGALTCGAATQGRTQVHTTPLQYCDNAGTPVLRYAAYGESDGDAVQATQLVANGANCPAGQAAGGVDALGAFEACVDPIVSTEIDACSELALLWTDETGTCGGPVLSTSPTFVTDIRTPIVYGSASAATPLLIASNPSKDADVDIDSVSDWFPAIPDFVATTTATKQLAHVSGGMTGAPNGGVTHTFFGIDFDGPVDLGHSITPFFSGGNLTYGLMRLAPSSATLHSNASLALFQLAGTWTNDIIPGYALHRGLLNLSTMTSATAGIEPYSVKLVANAGTARYAATSGTAAMAGAITFEDAGIAENVHNGVFRMNNLNSFNAIPTARNIGNAANDACTSTPGVPDACCTGLDRGTCTDDVSTTYSVGYAHSPTLLTNANLSCTALNVPHDCCLNPGSGTCTGANLTASSVTHFSAGLIVTETNGNLLVTARTGYNHGRITSATLETNDVTSDIAVDIADTGTTTGGATVTARSLRSAGVNVPMLHAGDVMIGSSTVVPSATLHVQEATAGNEVQRLESVATNDDPNQRVFQQRLQTTNATKTTLHNFTTASDRVYLVRASVVARCVSGAGCTAGQGAGCVLKATMKNVGGTVSRIDTTSTVDYAASDITAVGACTTVDATSTVTLQAAVAGGCTANTDFCVRVTGGATHTITWHDTLEMQDVGT